MSSCEVGGLVGVWFEKFAHTPLVRSFGRRIYEVSRISVGVVFTPPGIIRQSLPSPKGLDSPIFYSATAVRS